MPPPMAYLLILQPQIGKSFIVFNFYFLISHCLLYSILHRREAGPLPKLDASAVDRVKPNLVCQFAARQKSSLFIIMLLLTA